MAIEEHLAIGTDKDHARDEGSVLIEPVVDIR